MGHMGHMGLIKCTIVHMALVKTHKKALNSNESEGSYHASAPTRAFTTCHSLYLFLDKECHSSDRIDIASYGNIQITTA